MTEGKDNICSPTLGGDILRGADHIATFLYGESRHRRKVYNLIETNRLPYFRLGSTVCARKSVLVSWIKAQEDLNVGA
jgi:excisionase family DNA binding protein